MLALKLNALNLNFHSDDEPRDRKQMWRILRTQHRPCCSGIFGAEIPHLINVGTNSLYEILRLFALWAIKRTSNEKQEKKEPTDDTSIDVYSQYVNSPCFGHHYSHRQGNRLYKTACGVSLDVLAAVVWRSSCPDSTQPQPAHPG